MPDESQGWGLSHKERLMVLGIRASGLLLFGLGIPVIQNLIWLVYSGGWAGPDGEQFWSISNFLHVLLTKSFIVGFVSSIGVYLAAIVAGLYLMRCDPRPMLRSAGVKV